MVTQAAEIILWVSIGAVVYAYLGYPLLIWVLSRVFGRHPSPPADLPDAEVPTVTLLIAAYNEQRVIGERIRDALLLDYPASRFTVVVASDGSSDETNAIVRRYETDPRVRLLAYPERRGKAAVLNSAFQELSSDIVVLSDANTSIEPGALRKMVRWFRVPDVGVVCGRLILTDPLTGNNVDSTYWKYETFLKTCESRLGALLGANGAIYAMRRELFQGIRPNTLIDDFVIPLLVRIRTGRPICYERDAVAFEETPEGIDAEFKRRTRIATGGFQSLSVLWPLLAPTQGWIALAFFSHKVARWLCPFFLIAALAANALLIASPLYAALLAFHVAIYGVAVFGIHHGKSGFASRLVRLTSLFAGMNLALLVGFWRWLTSEPSGAWSRTARS